MLKRFYVDNYKCLVDFELVLPARTTLLVGLNGTGKSAIFDLLANIRAFVVGGTATELFSWRSLTRWQTSEVQTFELHAIGGPGAASEEYRYTLEIEQDPARQRSWVRCESVAGVQAFYRPERRC